MKSNTLTKTIGITVICAFGTLGQAAPRGAATLTSADRTFVDNLARANMAEIELGQVAQQKASSPDVKDFGQRMVNDHTQLNNDLKNWAQTNSVTLPTTISAASASQKQKLEGLSGAAFDKAYMQYMVTDHQHDVQEAQQEIARTQDPELKALTQKALPVLQDHLQRADTIAGQMGIKTKKMSKMETSK